MEKQYLALVEGKLEVGKEMEVDQPIHNPKGSGVCRVDSVNGKEAKTKFKVVKSNEKYSLLHCFPLTGRTHQIRLHLQWLGHPIANDPCYGNNSSSAVEIVDSEGNGADFYDQLIANKHKNSFLNTLDKKERSKKQENQENSEGEQVKGKQEKQVDELCDLCELDFPQPEKEKMFLYLHAYSYKSLNKNHPFCFTTELPLWTSLAD